MNIFRIYVIYWNNPRTDTAGKGQESGPMCEKDTESIRYNIRHSVRYNVRYNVIMCNTTAVYNGFIPAVRSKPLLKQLWPRQSTVCSPLLLLLSPKSASPPLLLLASVSFLSRSPAVPWCWNWPRPGLQESSEERLQAEPDGSRGVWAWQVHLGKNHKHHPKYSFTTPLCLPFDALI